MNILEHRFCASGPDGHVLEGCTIRDGRAARAMTASAIVVKGQIRNIRVQLGDLTLEPGIGTTSIDPPRRIDKGDPLDIAMAGNGSVELVGRRIGKYERTEDHPLDHEAFRAERALDDARAAGDAAAITQAERQLATAREALCGPSR